MLRDSDARRQNGSGSHWPLIFHFAHSLLRPRREFPSPVIREVDVYRTELFLRPVDQSAKLSQTP